MHTMSSPSRHPFLANPRKLHFIDGQWSASVTGEWIETRNPANGEVIAELARGHQEDIDRAVAAARRAFEGPWSTFTPQERTRLILRAHDKIAEHFDELAALESLDMGNPLSRMLSRRKGVLEGIMYFATQTMNYAGETIPNSLPGNFTTMTIKAPVGVVGGIIPWNGPLFNQWWILGGALATGCTVVMKPAEDASLTVLRTAELLMDVGLPEGVVNVVTGLGSEAGAALASHPDVDRVCFTGSTETGRKIIQSSAVNIKRLQLELGGKSPDVVFEDADLDKAVPGAAMAVYTNAGQICFSGTRLLVQRSIHDKFLDKLAAFSKTLKVGNPLDSSVNLGPIVSERQLERIMGYVAAGKTEGAELVTGGTRLGGELSCGYFVEPTVFANVHNEMKIAREEIFGPVISVIPFDTVEEALRISNATEYGLAGGVWTSNVATMSKMMHGIRAGTVWVNCYGMVDTAVGMGGFKHSGYGWKGGRDHVEGFLYKKSVVINGD